MMEHLESAFPPKPLATPPTILAVIKKNQSHIQEQNDASEPVEPLETKSAEVTQVKDTSADEERPPVIKQPLKPQLKKNQSLALKFLASTTNANGDVFTTGSKILVRTSTFGNYNAIIEELYQTADGIVWAKFSPFPADPENPQRWGCCRALLLVHSPEN
jgi:hypothetical protein